MRIILAPMQGVLDACMRAMLTQHNNYDYCVTEFLRVVNVRLPNKVFYRLCPELKNGGKTPAGTPVRVQILGQDPNCLADNAGVAIELGSFGVDLNCGCPSKTVNGSQGGASLLKDPELIYRATLAMRQAVSNDQVLSVKVRLGWEDYSKSLEIAQAVEAGGANEITIHGRTKLDGYKVESINWSKIGEIRSQLTIPVIANGEILDLTSLQQCQTQSGCQDFMVARGALSTPNLSHVLKHQALQLHWQTVLQLLQEYATVEPHQDKGFYHVARVKQWLKMLTSSYPQAHHLFLHIKPLKSQTELLQIILEARSQN